MNKQNRKDVIIQLQEKGYRQAKGIRGLYLNQIGKVYSLPLNKEIKPSKRNYIKVGSELISLPKLLLLTFKGQEYRTGQITFIDGNNQNLSINNIKYNCLHTPQCKQNVDKEGLLTAIRCYFEVSKKYKVSNSPLTRLYINEILNKRLFYVKCVNQKHIEVFKTYINGYTNSITKTAQEYNLSVRDCTTIVNGYLNTLINDILSELADKKLSVQEYSIKKSPISEYNEILLSYGLKPIRKRKKSTKELIKEFTDQANKIQKM